MSRYVVEGMPSRRQAKEGENEKLLGTFCGRSCTGVQRFYREIFPLDSAVWAGLRT